MKARSFLAVLVGCLTCIQANAQTLPSEFTTATRYDAMRRVVGTISPDPDGTGTLLYAAVRNTYDNAGRLTKVEKGQLSTWQSEAVAPSAWTGFSIYQTITTTYDAQNRKTKDVLSSGSTTFTATQYSYDLPGRLSCTAVRMNPAAFASLPASACTLGTQGTFGPDRITRNVYDNAWQLLKVQKAYATTLQQDYATYTYTPNGKQATVADAKGNKSLMTFNGLDRLVQLNFPSKTSPGTWSTTDYEQYTYDANGNRESLRKRDGQVINYIFDDLNRVSRKDIPGTTGDVYYDYNARGAQLYARFGSISGQGVTYTYDGFGRPLTSTTNMGGTARTLGYEFDADGNRTRLTFPDSNYFTFTFDGLNRMKSILTNGTTLVTNLSYDTRGRRSSLSIVVGTSYGYDGANRLTSLSHNLAGTAQDVTFTFSSYNPASQLVTQSRNNDSYAWTGAVSVNRGYAANGLNQYTTVGSVSPVHDANGNLNTDGSSTYQYDVENRLISAAGATNATLTYDPMGRLYQTVGSTTTRFLYDGDALVAEYDGSGNLTRRYVHGPGVDEPLVRYDGSGFGTRRYLRADALGSVIALVDSSGNSVATTSYDEYGQRGSGNVGRFQYTGQIEIPELGLYYYKARMYSPKWGRFLQTDPIGYEDDLNLYSYTYNDPMNRIDPSGTAVETPWDAANVAMDVASLAGNVAAGNVGSAMLDAAGLVYDVIATAVPVLPGGAGALIKAGRVADNARDTLNANKARGKVGEGLTRGNLGDKVAGEQVTFKTSDGTTTRTDFVTKEANGKGAVETKTGQADLSTGQRKFQDDIAAGRDVVPVGQNAAKAGFEPGVPVKLCVFRVDRPC